MSFHNVWPGGPGGSRNSFVIISPVIKGFPQMAGEHKFYTLYP
ncbi:hypothetical protein EV681_2735 [Advenella incenata]|uniref:Uncharacterized protein n=1 Tax=Advenella incenata TaxID=267800 RepID=A0A4Q7VE00_9BURK|nr:hypothetical protein EV681_2735 [Advenella incenata]